jgi:hypothetical protein
MRFVVVALLAACGRPTAEEPVQPAPIVEAPAPEAPNPAPTPAAGRVFFVSPADGATVTSPVKLVFGVEGMEIRPAGDLTANTGHHHLIVSDVGVPAGQAVPNDPTHIHFGQGQTEAEIPLAPGTHKLTMQFADGNHLSYGEPLAATITITVAEPK